MGQTLSRLNDAELGDFGHIASRYRRATRLFFPESSSFSLGVSAFPCSSSCFPGKMAGATSFPAYEFVTWG